MVLINYFTLIKLMNAYTQFEKRFYGKGRVIKPGATSSAMLKGSLRDVAEN